MKYTRLKALRATINLLKDNHWEDQERDDRGRFGSGNGGSSNEPKDPKVERAEARQQQRTEKTRANIERQQSSRISSTIKNASKFLSDKTVATPKSLSTDSIQAMKTRMKDDVPKNILDKMNINKNTTIEQMAREIRFAQLELGVKNKGDSHIDHSLTRSAAGVMLSRAFDIPIRIAAAHLEAVGISNPHHGGASNKENFWRKDAPTKDPEVRQALYNSRPSSKEYHQALNKLGADTSDNFNRYVELANKDDIKAGQFLNSAIVYNMYNPKAEVDTDIRHQLRWSQWSLSDMGTSIGMTSISGSREAKRLFTEASDPKKNGNKTVDSTGKTRSAKNNSLDHIVGKSRYHYPERPASDSPADIKAWQNKISEINTNINHKDNFFWMPKASNSEKNNHIVDKKGKLYPHNTKLRKWDLENMTYESLLEYRMVANRLNHDFLTGKPYTKNPATKKMFDDQIKKAKAERSRNRYLGSLGLNDPKGYYHSPRR